MLRRLLLPTVLVLGALAAPARALDVGLADQKATSYADARLRGLHLPFARLIVPWNAATTEPAAVQQWLDAARAAGMTPHVAFEHARTDQCPSRPCVLPTAAQYGAAVRAFVARFPDVTTYTTWNEANHESQPTAYAPEAVPGYYDQLRAACPSCTIVAGDVLDAGDYAGWLRRYLAASTTVPALWGLHNYGDVTHGRTTGTDTVLSIVPGQVWVEETGGIVSLRNRLGRTTFTTTETAAAAAIDRAFAIAAARPRITRMYIYQWVARPFDAFDAGLVRPDGTTRPSYDALVRDLGLAAPAAAPKATTATASLRWTATWSKRARRLALRATCRATSGRCRGRATITLRVGTKSARLKTRAYATTSAHRTQTLRLVVGTTAWRRARRASAKTRLTVRVTATPTLPAGAPRATSTVRLAHPPIG